MKTNLIVVINQEELAGIVANHLVLRLKSLLPMSQSGLFNIESDLIENITLQISKSVTIQIIDGEVVAPNENPEP